MAAKPQSEIPRGFANGWTLHSMKYLLFIMMLIGSNPINAATISVSGVIEGTSQRSGFGETIDYLKFEMLTTGLFNLVGDSLPGRFLTLAAYSGDNSQFSAVSSPSVLFFTRENLILGTVPTLSRTLNAGQYILIVDAVEDSQYDFGDGFVPVNEDGGFFPYAEYRFTILIRSLLDRSGSQCFLSHPPVCWD
jgi:hypothetical protein